MTIYKIFRFDAAHYLPNVPTGHKCGGMHGHTYVIKVHISGDVQSYTGWVMDFAHIKNIIKPLIDLVDHKILNDIPGLQNPTSEHVCMWFWQRIKPAIPGLQRIELNETPDSGVIYEG